MQCDHMRMPGAGSSRGREERKYTQADSSLEKVFEKWLNEHKDENMDYDYALAQKLLKKKQYPADNIHALLLAHHNHEHITHAGLFASAVYNTNQETNIVYDLSIPVNWLGYKLPKHKTLTNTGTTGNDFGELSSGLVLNTGKTGKYFGELSSGLVLNTGKTRNWFGELSSGLVLNTGTTSNIFGWESSGLVLNTGKTGNDFGWGSSGLVLNTGTTGDNFGGLSSGLVITRCAPKSYGTLHERGRLIKPQENAQIQGLDAYITTLTKQLTSLADVSKAAELQAWCTANPPKKIRSEIEKLLQGAGYEV